MSYIKSDVFIDVATQCNYEPNLIREELQKLNPSYSASNYTINSRISNYRRKGLLPLDSGNFVSLGETLKGTSTLFGSDGSIKQQWIKTDVPKQQQLDAFEAAVTAIAAKVTPAIPTTVIPTTSSDLLTVYPIGDAHVGMLAWEPETGADSDLSTIEHSLTTAMSLLVEQAPFTEEAFIIDVGELIADVI